MFLLVPAYPGCLGSKAVKRSLWLYFSNILEEGSGLDVIYLDYKKAFDTVPHQKLLHKLKGLRLGDVLTKWIEQFLLGREMRVHVNGKMSYNSQTELLQFADCQRVEQATTGRRGGTVNQHVQEQAGSTLARYGHSKLTAT